MFFYPLLRHVITLLFDIKVRPLALWVHQKETCVDLFFLEFLFPDVSDFKMRAPSVCVASDRVVVLSTFATEQEWEQVSISVARNILLAVQSDVPSGWGF